MFTGIIDHTGTIIEVIQQKDTVRVWIKSQFHNIELGESIAIDGVCLTVTKCRDNDFCCDISAETLMISTFSQMKEGQVVNLERAVQVGARLGGHIVSGHVDAVATLSSQKPLSEFIQLSFTVNDPSAKGLLIKKGSIAINGVSLTINTLEKNSFQVMLIPHTLERTNLSLLAEGSKVNIEYDMIAKMIAEQCQTYLKHMEK